LHPTWDFSPFWDLSPAAARLALAEIAVPVGVAAAAGIALAATIPPHWRAPGMPYLLGYGKNVELAAVAGALAAGAATRLCVGSRLGLAACALLAAGGFALVAVLCPLAPLVAAWPQLLAVAILATAAGTGWRTPASSAPPGPPRPPGEAAPPGRAATPDRVSAPGQVAPPGPVAPTRDLPALAAALLVAALALATAAVTAGPPLLIIDTYHHGEVLSTAVDLLRGGRPFETMIWPHGLHDTGLAALWILVTGKIGTSPVALARATCCGLGIVAVYLLARPLLGSRLEAIAACSVLALAPLVIEPTLEQSWVIALDRLGQLLFVALAFAVLTSARPVPPASGAGAARATRRGRILAAVAAARRELLAGACLGLGYLFRIETALYGALAALAVIVWRELAATAEPRARAAAAAVRALLSLAAGATLVLAGARLLAGWPGAAWYEYTLRELPRFHRDAMGGVLPWPRRGISMSPYDEAWLGMALAGMLLVLLLLVQAVREAVVDRHRQSPGEGQRTPRLLFVAVFAAVALKSHLDRSDPSHVLQWSALPLLATACLALAGVRERRSWGRGRSIAALVLLLAAMDFGRLGLQLPATREGGLIAAAARERWRGFVEHLSPNPPVGGCADRTFTPAESRLGANHAFIADTCEVEALLRAHGVRRLVIADSAPWYHLRFRLPWPTRTFAMARADSPPRQRELVDQLRRSRPQALLLPEGHGAIRDFDVPDAVRVPVVDAYLRARRRGVDATPTPLGELFFWDERAPCPAVAPPAARADHPAVPRLATQLAAYQPASGVLFARGWAVDAATGRRLPAPVLALHGRRPGADGGIEYGLGGNAASAMSGGRAVQRDGWELWLRGWRRGAGRQGLCVEAGAGAGAPLPSPCVEIDLSQLRILGPLEGAEWAGLGAEVARAEAMGRADRLRALAMQPASCGAAGRPPGS
jgi:hypothetical protein